MTIHIYFALTFALHGGNQLCVAHRIMHLGMHIHYASRFCITCDKIVYNGDASRSCKIDLIRVMRENI
jgi:hypothetical protein